MEIGSEFWEADSLTGRKNTFYLEERLWNISLGIFWRIIG